jgi:RNA polymerase sigma-70 factor (ECF subfamily)
MSKSAELIGHLKAGDREAFSELVELYGDRVFNLARKILHNSLDAEDVVQETFSTVYQKIDTFHEQSDLFTWIFRIATNFALMKLRKGKKESFVSDELEKYDNLKSPLSARSPLYTDQSLLDTELSTELDRALNNIPEKYKTIFVLRDLENLSTAETAAVLEISEANVKVRLRRARLFLRDQLCEYFDRCKDEE